MVMGWSFALMAIGLIGLWLVGQKRKSGWAISFFGQTVWITYAVVTRQWGFIISAVAYGYINARSWLKWRQDERRISDESLRDTGGRARVWIA